MTALAPTAAHRRLELVEHAGDAGSVLEVFQAASERLRPLVDFDAAAWIASDPATSLPTSPTRTENHGDRGLSQAQCRHVWQLEFLAEDVNRFRDLVGENVPAAGLRAVTGDLPARSTRYREVLRPAGFDDELRAVLRADGSAWGVLALLREAGRPPFSAEDVDLVAGLSRPLGEAVRDHARPSAQPRAKSDDDRPGVMLFAPQGDLVSINDEAAAWLEELASLEDLRGVEHVPAMGGVRVPLVVMSTVAHARAVAEERDHGTARAHVRSPVSGRWLTCHASCLRQPTGEVGSTAFVIEPARASEVAPIVVKAVALSPREEQITQLIARGFATAEIAAQLYLSRHTVRDYVKAILDKAGVSSRGELVAKLFAEHYSSLRADPAHQAVDGKGSGDASTAGHAGLGDDD